MTNQSTQTRHLKKLHAKSFRGKEKLKRAKLAGCFHCLSTYRPQFITEYVDDGLTARCPRCGIDAVIPLSYIVPKTTQRHMRTLKKLKTHYFDQ